MTEMRCWWCGIEPADVIEYQQLCQPEPQLIPVWPAGDHTHAVNPPSSEQLTAAGHHALSRVREYL